MASKILWVFLVLTGCSVLSACSSVGKPVAKVSVQLSDTNALFTGRFLTRDNRHSFSWPGSSIAFRFKGSHAGLTIRSNQESRFRVMVDGSSSTLVVGAGENYYALADGLHFAEHSVVLTRETESFNVVTTLGDTLSIYGEMLSPPAPKERKLLVFGDSITAGYGVEGENKECSYDHHSSTALKAYAALAADKLDAQLHIIAWSGIGVWRSYGETTSVNPTMLERYNRTLAGNAQALWNANRYMPAAIMVNIGTNDYWDGNIEGYPAAMERFVAALQGRYTSTPIYLLPSPMLQGKLREQQVAVLKGLQRKGVKFVDIGKIEQSDGLGCDYHPNTVTQSRLAARLTHYLKSELSW